jgi:oligoendopeptidase F
MILVVLNEPCDCLIMSSALRKIYIVFVNEDLTACRHECVSIVFYIIIPLYVNLYVLGTLLTVGFWRDYSD